MVLVTHYHHVQNVNGRCVVSGRAALTSPTLCGMFDYNWLHAAGLTSCTVPRRFTRSIELLDVVVVVNDAAVVLDEGN